MGKMRRGKIEKEEFIKKRKEYRNWCEEEKERLKKEEEERINSIRTEEEAWKYINKFRKKREGIGKNIGIEKWRDHFMQLLEGAKERVVLEEEEEEGGNEKEEEEEDSIGKEELVRQLTKLKKGKAPSENGIENEAWRLMPTEIGEAFMEMINKIWREGCVPEEWNRGLICPLFKRGDKEDVKNYRGVTLMNTAYKVLQMRL